MDIRRYSQYPLCGAVRKRGLPMSRQSGITRFGALLAIGLAVALSFSPAHAREEARKVGVVSFGLFGDQGVFRREATGAAQVVAGRFGTGRIDVQYNSRSG